MTKKLKLIRPALWLSCFILLGALPLPVAAQGEPNTNRPAIYDESADGAQQIADALIIAKKDGKNVLLQFGANWCVWCHRLHTLCATNPDIAKVLRKNFVVVLIDVNQKHNAATDAKYGHPIRFGLPVLVVLDANGQLLTTEDSGKLEEGDHHSPEKVLAFLKAWTPKK
jgi:thiol:disulfide interchange protein